MDDGSGGAAPAWLRAARASREAVEAALRRRDLAPRVRERLEMVKGVALGQPLAEVARWSGRTERTVVGWLTAFASGGVGALADAPRAGRPVRADGAYLAALERTVDTPPRQ
jgi:transposase